MKRLKSTVFLSRGCVAFGAFLCLLSLKALVLYGV